MARFSEKNSAGLRDSATVPLGGIFGREKKTKHFFYNPKVSDNNFHSKKHHHADVTAVIFYFLK